MSSSRLNANLTYTRFCCCPDECECPYKIGNVAFQPEPGWSWSKTDCTETCTVSDDGKTIIFHGEGFSNGNACIRADTPMVRGMHYYWELSIRTPLYGSSVMIGVGTKDVELNKFYLDFVDMLGNDENQSWGLSYRGDLRCNNQAIPYSPPGTYSHGTLVGVYLDMVAGTLQFYINRVPIDATIADPALIDLTLYPIITSTAALTSIKLTYAVSHPHNLSFLAARQVKLSRPNSFPQGVRKIFSDYWWLLPKSIEKDVVLPMQKPEESPGSVDDVEYNSGVFVYIDSDDETGGLLPARMKRVLENSQNESTGLRLRVKRERYSMTSSSS